MEKWIHKWQVKKRWGIEENELMQLVRQGKLKSYDAEYKHVKHCGIWYDTQKEEDIFPINILSYKISYFDFGDILNFEQENNIIPTVELEEQAPEEEQHEPAPIVEIPPENALTRKGDFWEIVFHGNKLNPIANMKGMFYLAKLLDNPGKYLHVSDLYKELNPGELPYKAHPRESSNKIDEDDLEQQLQSGNMSISTMQDEGLSVDEKRRFTERLNELKEIISEPDSLASEKEEAVKEAIKIKEILEKEFGKKPLHHNAPRKLNESVKQSLDNVGKAVDRAIKKIDEQSPELSKYLDDNLDKGSGYRFKDQDIGWHISF